MNRYNEIHTSNIERNTNVSAHQLCKHFISFTKRLVFYLSLSLFIILSLESFNYRSFLQCTSNNIFEGMSTWKWIKLKKINKKNFWWLTRKIEYEKMNKMASVSLRHPYNFSKNEYICTYHYPISIIRKIITRSMSTKSVVEYVKLYSAWNWSRLLEL
mgnify:CR=1 FL=1